MPRVGMSCEVGAVPGRARRIIGTHWLPGAGGIQRVISSNGPVMPGGWGRSGRWPTWRRASSAEAAARSMSLERRSVPG